MRCRRRTRRTRSWRQSLALVLEQIVEVVTLFLSFRLLRGADRGGISWCFKYDFSYAQWSRWSIPWRLCLRNALATRSGAVLVARVAA